MLNIRKAGFVKFKNILSFAYALILILVILLSSFFPISVDNGGQIGVAAGVLAIGDRPFYINDTDPFGKKGYTQTNQVGPILYPKILEGVTWIASSFGSNTFSRLWNLLVITISGLASLLTLNLLFHIAFLSTNQRTAKLTCILFVINPYNYYYVLTGGITPLFLLAFGSFCYATLKTFEYLRSFSKLSWSLVSLQILCAAFLCSIRPNGIIIVAVTQSLLIANISLKSGIVHTPQQSNNVFIVYSRLVIMLTFSLLLSLLVLLPSIDYVSSALTAYNHDSGTFFGIDRENIRKIIANMFASSEIINKAKGILILILWRSIDCFSGFLDLRDTYNPDPALGELLATLVRLIIAFVFALPIGMCSLAGMVVLRKDASKSGLLTIAIGAIASLSYSLLGFANSRYLYMVSIPFLIYAAGFLDRIKITLPRK